MFCGQAYNAWHRCLRYDADESRGAACAAGFATNALLLPRRLAFDSLASPSFDGHCLRNCERICTAPAAHSDSQAVAHRAQPASAACVPTLPSSPRRTRRASCQVDRRGTPPPRIANHSRGGIGEQLLPGCTHAGAVSVRREPVDGGGPSRQLSSSVLASCAECEQHQQPPVPKVMSRLRARIQHRIINAHR